MAITEVTLPEQSVTYDPSAAPDAPLPSPAYNQPTTNYGSLSGNGSFTVNGVEAQPNTASPVTTNNDQQTTSNPNIVATGDLPWAVVLMPTTSAGQGGIGNNKHSLQPETWVYGIWADGDDCQQPLVIGVIPGSGGGSSGGSSGSTSGGTSSTSSSDSVGNLPQGRATLNQNTQTVYNTLKAGGFSHEQACGIMGNAQQESGFNTRAHNNIAGGHTGLFQWDSSRWSRFQRMFPGKTYDAEAQTKYLIWELNGPEAKYVKMLKMKTNDVQAAAIGMANSERFGGPGGWTPGRFRASGGLNGYDISQSSDLRQRIANARALASKMGSTSSPTRPSSSSTPAAISNTAPTS